MAIVVTEFCDRLFGGGEMSEGQKFDFLGTKLKLKFCEFEKICHNHVTGFLFWKLKNPFKREVLENQ